MEYNSKNAKRWARLGERPVLGMAIQELAQMNQNIMVVVADVASSAGLSRMKTELPDQIIDVGIAEQNMMGIAAGLSSEGYTVYTATFAPFQTMRCMEQIRVNLGYMQQKVVMCGLASGMAYGELGFTHCCIEDLAIMRAIPNICVMSPADCTELVKMIDASVDYDMSIYIRLMNKTNIPVVYSDDFDFRIGYANFLERGNDVALVATGTMVYQSLEAAKKLRERGISATVVDVHTIKPLDTECIFSLTDHKAIVTVEEHTIIGGLGSAVAECLASKRHKPPQLMIGINDCFPHAGSYEYLLEQCGLLGRQIADRVEAFVTMQN